MCNVYSNYFSLGFAESLDVMTILFILAAWKKPNKKQTKNNNKCTIQSEAIQ